MALRDTSWVLDTADASKDSQSIITKYDKDPNESIFLTTGTELTRSRTIVTREWICLTGAAAQSVVDTKAVTPDTKATYKAVPTNQIVGAWKVVKHLDSRSAWS